MRLSAITLSALIAALTIGHQSVAGEPHAGAAVRTKVRRSATRPSRTSSFQFGSLVAYGNRLDLADEREPRKHTHRLATRLSLTFLDRSAPIVTEPGMDADLAAAFADETAQELVSFHARVSGQMLTIGNEIEAGPSGIAELADIDAWTSKTFSTGRWLGAESSLEIALGSTFPTSIESQYEGYIAAPYLSAAWSLAFAGGRYVVEQGLSTDLVVNRYEYSPVTRETNPESSIGYSGSILAKLGAGFYVVVAGQARAVRHLDHTVTAALANTQELAWSRGLFSLSLKHANGSRAEDRETTLWFVDQYRRVITLGAAVRF